MNLSKLFPIQKKLDDRIVKEKGLEGQDLLDEKILALQVELGELANEWRGFKFWSEDQSPNITYCHACNGYGYFDSTYQEACGYCHATGIQENPLLEEYVDTIHFAISIANDLGVHEHEYLPTRYQDLNLAVIGITNLATIIVYSRKKDHIRSLLNNLITLGYQFGFTETDVKKAYDKKNAENYVRQKVGY